MADEILIDGKVHDLGDGFIVRRALPVAKKRTIGPFVFFDHMGPVDLKVGNGMDVRPHPHIGLSTLTYLFDGEILHKDTLGVEQLIRPGEVNWMTAGKGIAHSERSPQESRKRAQRIHGIQIWIGLPKESEEIDPSFHHYASGEIPRWNEGPLKASLVVGKYGDLKSPVSAYSQTTYIALDMPAGASFTMPADGQELGVYCVEGKIRSERNEIGPGQIGVFPLGEDPRFKSVEPSRVILLGGKPFPETRHVWWNFVSSEKSKIDAAKLRWRSQEFGRISGETEFIPLPEGS